MARTIRPSRGASRRCSPPTRHAARVELHFDNETETCNIVTAEGNSPASGAQAPSPTVWGRTGGWLGGLSLEAGGERQDGGRDFRNVAKSYTARPCWPRGCRPILPMLTVPSGRSP